MSVADDAPFVQFGALYVAPEGHTQSEHTLAAVAVVNLPGLQLEHVVRPLEAAKLPAAQAVHVSAVAAAHVCATAVLLHEYCEDARFPLYPALHAHVIWYGCAFDVTVAPLCTALAGALMAVHAEHVIDAGDHAPVAAPHDVDVGATP